MRNSETILVKFDEIVYEVLLAVVKFDEIRLNIENKNETMQNVLKIRIYKKWNDVLIILQILENAAGWAFGCKNRGRCSRGRASWKDQKDLTISEAPTPLDSRARGSPHPSERDEASAEEVDLRAQFELYDTDLRHSG